MVKKIRESFLIKPGNRSQETKEKFSNWIEAQSNAQNSILALISHVVDRFGYVDIMDHEIAKKMYADILNAGSKKEIDESKTQLVVDPFVQKQIATDKPKSNINIDVSKY